MTGVETAWCWMGRLAAWWFPLAVFVGSTQVPAYPVFMSGELTRQVRTVRRQVEKEASERALGNPGPGTPVVLREVARELAALEHNPSKLDGNSWRHRDLRRLRRLVRDWPHDHPLTLGVRKVIELAPPQHP